MADFCKQCSHDIFGRDFGDLAGMCTKDDNHNGYYTKGLCEGCAGMYFDYTGKCVDPECRKKHGKAT